MINVEVMDEFAKNVRYACKARGLPAGVRTKLRELVNQLAAAPCLHQNHVYLFEGEYRFVTSPRGRRHRLKNKADDAQTQTVLDPLRTLYGVRKVNIRGVSKEYAEVLTKGITAQRGLSTNSWLGSGGWMGYIARLDNIYASAPKP
jgi:hypothetical protein